MSEKLCLFCCHYRWTKERMWGMGGTYTGPMFEGGDSVCAKEHEFPHYAPADESEYRENILKATDCADYEYIG